MRRSYVSLGSLRNEKSYIKLRLKNKNKNRKSILIEKIEYWLLMAQ